MAGGIFNRIKSAFGLSEKPLVFARFRDGLGNFEISYPQGWKYDEDIAVVEGKYTISFLSPDGLSQFTVAVDAQQYDKFDFSRYAKAELSSPSSGIYTALRKSDFRKMPAYFRDYCYDCGKRYFGGGVMFFNGELVFSVSWSAPESQGGVMHDVFRHMLDSMAIKEAHAAFRRKKTVRRKLGEMKRIGGIKET